MSVCLQKILYIDDEVDLLAVVKMSLEALGGYSVTTCVNGEMGIVIAQAWKPDLILLDVMMPILDGPSTLKRLQETECLRHIPVVFMTARTAPEQLEHYKAIGAAATIPKPFDALGLPGVVQNIWQATHTTAVSTELSANHITSEAYLAIP